MRRNAVIVGVGALGLGFLAERMALEVVHEIEPVQLERAFPNRLQPSLVSHSATLKGKIRACISIRDFLSASLRC